MSYYVSIRIMPKCNNDPIIIFGDCNTTWNVRELIKQSSGWDIINENSNGTVLPWLDKIRTGIANLTKAPKEYKKYEDPDGWGTVVSTLRFYYDCENMAKDFISEYGDLVNEAVVWVD